MRSERNVLREPGRIDITVAMPALNEERDIAAAITSTLAAFREYEIEGEVIVINDGSTDGTREIVLKMLAEEPRVRLINHDRPRGIGASFWAAVELGEGEAVCMIPGDNENDPFEILRYWQLLEHVDIVVPFVFNKHVRSKLRNTLSYVYRTLINISFGLSFNYTNGTVICRRALLKALPNKDPGFFFTTDILIRLSHQGFLFAEVPYRLSTRKSGETKAVTWSALMQVTRGYLRLAEALYFSPDAIAPPSETQTHARRAAGTWRPPPPPQSSYRSE
jgi:phenylacetate-CoA ligase